MLQQDKWIYFFILTNLQFTYFHLKFCFVCVFIQQLPVVPLFGDMQISLISYVTKCPHFEPARWSCASENAEEKIGQTQYNLTGKIDMIQDEHLKFMCELSRTNNEVCLGSK